MPLDWWLAFLVFLLGACVILLVALSSRRRHQRAEKPELVLGPQTDRPVPSAAPTDVTDARPVPYLAYLPQAESAAAVEEPPDAKAPAESTPAAVDIVALEPAPPDPTAEIAVVPVTADADVADTSEVSETDIAPTQSSSPRPVVLHPAASPSPDIDVPWWEQAFLDNPPPSQVINRSPRPWHSDEPLPPPPQDQRSRIHALLTMGARSSTTVTSGAVKGNRSSGLYHTVESPWYGRTKADEWFDTPGKAEAAGYIRWDDKVNRRTG